MTVETSHIFAIVIGLELLLVNVAVCAELVVPTGCWLKFIVDGFSVTFVPSPVRPNTVGLAGSLLLP